LKTLDEHMRRFIAHSQMPEFDVAKLQTLLDEAYRSKLY
jgi:hypothetical protein